MIKKSLTLFSIFILSVIFSSSIWAVKPYSETYIGEYPYFIVDCGDYDVYQQIKMRETETWYYNQDGEETRYHWSAHMVESRWFNSEDDSIYIVQGKFGRGENVSFWLDYVTGDWQSTGGQYRITIPGIGPVYMETGRWHWDGETMYRSGASVAPENGTASALCEALAPLP